MSFFGKKYKKGKSENVEELLDALNVPEKGRALFNKADTITSFNKNDDGSIQLIISSDGKAMMDHKIELDKEVEFTTPDGVATKIKTTLDGNVLKSVFKYTDGKIVHLDRHFEDSGLKLVFYVDGVGTKSTIHYDEV